MSLHSPASWKVWDKCSEKGLKRRVRSVFAALQVAALWYSYEVCSSRLAYSHLEGLDGSVLSAVVSAVLTEVGPVIVRGDGTVAGEHTLQGPKAASTLAVTSL